MPDAITLLKQDHRTVERMFERFERTGDSTIAQEICQELRVHTTIEEEIVYPVLRDKVDRTMAQEAQKEHQEAKQLIGRIERQNGGTQLRRLVTRLKQAIEQHVEEEETEVFPEMRQKVGGELTRMGDQLARRKQQLTSSRSPDLLLDLTKDELYDRARSAGIDGRSRMNKKELARALQRQG